MAPRRGPSAFAAAAAAPSMLLPLILLAALTGKRFREARRGLQGRGEDGAVAVVLAVIRFHGNAHAAAAVLPPPRVRRCGSHEAGKRRARATSCVPSYKLCPKLCPKLRPNPRSLGRSALEMCLMTAYRAPACAGFGTRPCAP
eukprot:358176-Chlamydomonas_euryale.AAC.4